MALLSSLPDSVSTVNVNHVETKAELLNGMGLNHAVHMLLEVLQWLVLVTLVLS